MSDSPVTVAGERLLCMPERTLYWEREATLFVADAHWGKAAAFRVHGLAVPGGTTAEGLARLDRAIDRTGARRVVFLGDFLHAREGRTPGTIGALQGWCERRRPLALVLVRGNHDRGAGDPPSDLCIRCVDPPLLDPPFVLAHHPENSDHGHVLAGHLHPGIRLAGLGGERARLACFWFGDRVSVLPAFGDFTGLFMVEPAPSDRVRVIAGDEVVSVTAE